MGAERQTYIHSYAFENNFSKPGARPPKASCGHTPGLKIYLFDEQFWVSVGQSGHQHRSSYSGHMYKYLYMYMSQCLHFYIISLSSVSHLLHAVAEFCLNPIVYIAHVPSSNWHSSLPEYPPPSICTTCLNSIISIIYALQHIYLTSKKWRFNENSMHVNGYNCSQTQNNTQGFILHQNCDGKNAYHYRYLTAIHIQYIIHQWLISSSRNWLLALRGCIRSLTLRNLIILCSCWYNPEIEQCNLRVSDRFW